MFVAIDRTSKFVFARLVKTTGKLAAAQVLRELIEAVPYRGIHAVLTDNGVQFTRRPQGIHDLGPYYLIASAPSTPPNTASQKWTSEPERYKRHPNHLIPGLKR
ncbi:MAG: hypothetical protein AAGG56_17445 [Pseudomonadota bacterium]